MEKVKFDDLSKVYDLWCMQNENLFDTELLLLKKALGDILGKKVLAVYCGSGIFESLIDGYHIEGIEPSVDMANIAKKRGIRMQVSTLKDARLESESYDIIYFNGSSSYMSELRPAYLKCFKALKPGGKIVVLDVPKESAFGFIYSLAKILDTFSHEYFEKALPEFIYPMELVRSGYWYTTEEKVELLKEVGITRFEYYQTLLNNPLYSNSEVEEIVEGYKKGGFVAIIGYK